MPIFKYKAHLYPGCFGTDGNTAPYLEAVMGDVVYWPSGLGAIDVIVTVEFPEMPPTPEPAPMAHIKAEPIKPTN